MHAAPEDPKAKEQARRQGKIRILLADDHFIIREGMATIFNNTDGFEVVAQASNGFEAVRLAEELRPDVILMDISMPGMDGIEATARIKKSQPDSRIIGLSMHDDDSTRARMIAAGATGYVDKAAPSRKLVEAIRENCLAESASAGKPA